MNMHDDLNRRLASTSLPEGTALDAKGFASARCEGVAVFLRKLSEHGALMIFAALGQASDLNEGQMLEACRALLALNLPGGTEHPLRYSMDREGRIWLGLNVPQEDQEGASLECLVDSFLGECPRAREAVGWIISAALSGQPARSPGEGMMPPPSSISATPLWG